ncbi:hypothetical protein ONZ45_g10608 [Pleurotus djamor]|nr:hypothetical protein ONZ45_g10608 [Pleurotus djamor]
MVHKIKSVSNPDFACRAGDALEEGYYSGAFTPEEAAEYIKIGTLNGLFVFRKSEWIGTVAAQYSSILPIRVFDITTSSFVTRSEVRNSIVAQLTQAFKTTTAPITDDEIEEFKRDINDFAELKTRFAILSHTWGAKELTYRGVMEGRQSLTDDQKFTGLRQNAETYKCRYIWMDSVCIDKSSSSELDESIRSMYAWYASAYVCFVHLQNTPEDWWLRRGWTLQELLAPKRLVFFNDYWRRRFQIEQDQGEFDIDKTSEGCRLGLRQLQIHQIRSSCHDAASVERSAYDLWSVDFTQLGKERLSFWMHEYNHTEISALDLFMYEPSAANARRIFSYLMDRETTVPEDSAYCLVGLLGIVLPPAYGEGKNQAFYRLQLACAERSNDRTLFLWGGCPPSDFNSMLPSNPITRPRCPVRCDVTYVYHNRLSDELLWRAIHPHGVSQSLVDHTFAFTNGGLRISVILHDCWRISKSSFIARDHPDIVLSVWGVDDTLPSSSIFKLAILGTHGCNLPGHCQAFTVILLKCGPSNIPQYRRVSWDMFNDALPPLDFLLSRAPEIVYIV